MYATLVSIVIGITSVIPQALDFKFAVIGDTQIKKRIMRKASLDMRKRKLSFVAHVGDVDYCGSFSKWRRSRRIMKLSGLSWYMTLGNHELYDCPLPIRIRYSKRRWARYWWGKGNSTFRVVNFFGKKFVFTDSSTYLYPRGHAWKLSRVLKNSQDNSVFIFTHRPPAYRKPFKIRYSSDRRYWHRYRVMDNMKYVGRNKVFWKTLKKYRRKILAMFHGHYHAFRYYKLDGISVYNTGGGGGWLETRRDYHHYLIVGVKNYKFYVKVIKL
jgi:predicted phosphodiesterase